MQWGLPISRVVSVTSKKPAAGPSDEEGNSPLIEHQERAGLAVLHDRCLGMVAVRTDETAPTLMTPHAYHLLSPWSFPDFGCHLGPSG